MSEAFYRIGINYDRHIILKASFLMSTLSVIELETAANPQFTVIWLHGLGANGNDFVPVIPELKLSSQHPVRFIFPNAPEIPVTINGGYIMPAWYDILEMSVDHRKVDQAGIQRSVEQIRQLISRENQRGIPSSHIFLAGFSQGGAIAYQAALSHTVRLAGVIALSTYIPDAQVLQAQFNPVQQQLPVLIAHGQYDGVVPLQMGKNACIAVEQLGCLVSWYEYGMEHQVCLEEIREIGTWLAKQIDRIKNLH